MINSTLEHNRDIADFMGWVHHHDAEYDQHEMRSLKFHSDWNELMRVKEKIESLESCSYGFTADPWGVSIIEYKTGKENIVCQCIRDDNDPFIEIYYQCITSFIENYKNDVSN